VRALRVCPLFVVAAFGVAAAASAQTAQPAKVPSPVAARSTRTIVGEIVSVDAEKNLVTVRESVSSPNQKGQTARRTVTLGLTPQTKLLRGKTSTSAAELKPNDFVVARYAETPAGVIALSLRVADVVARTAPATPAGPTSHEPRDAGQRRP
jgi:hypothetical protein